MTELLPTYSKDKKDSNHDWQIQQQSMFHLSVRKKSLDPITFLPKLKQNQQNSLTMSKKPRAPGKLPKFSKHSYHQNSAAESQRRSPLNSGQQSPRNYDS